MKPGNHIEVEVVALDSKGDGLALVGEREILVRGAVPGDRVAVRLIKKRKGRFEGVIEEYREMGYERQEPLCTHFGHCGGCRWQELAYDDQLKVKQQMIADALALSGLEIPILEPIIASPTPYFYRNKMEFSFGRDRDEGLHLGMHVRGRYNWIFDLEECHLQSQVSNRIVKSVRSAARELGLSAYDLKKHEGVLRFLVVRDGKQTEQVMVNLVIASYPNEKVDLLLAQVQEEIPEIDVLLVTLHTGKAQVAIGEQEYLIKGEGHIVEKCAGLEFDISPQSFFQTNPLQAERLYKVVIEMAGNVGKVLDMYCGTGSISLLLARQAESVLGVELAVEAIEDAKLNAKRNGIENCEFIAGAAEDVFGGLVAQERRFDLIVVDPPRAGLHKKALAGLCMLDVPRIIYVSCNPHTLAADLSGLAVAGYRVVGVRPVDMFPQTPHCEVVVELCKVECLTN